MINVVKLCVLCGYCTEHLIRAEGCFSVQQVCIIMKNMFSNFNHLYFVGIFLLQTTLKPTIQKMGPG